MSAPATGNGTTITFGTTGLAANVYSIGEFSHELAALDTSHLGTTGFMTNMPDDLESPGEFEIEIEFDTEEDIPARGTVETITITYPQRTGETAAANHAGTGYIRRWTNTELKNGQVQRAKVLVAWDGETGPTFTAATTA